MSYYPISVIIPTYNRSAYLDRAVSSVMRQTRKVAEIIIVDDGSTDETSKVVERLNKISATTIHYLHQENAGPASARNLGISASHFDHIAFLDSDDHWHRKKIEFQFAAMAENSEYMISHTREKWLRRGKHLNQKKHHIPRHGDIFDHCLALCAVGMSTVMLRKSLFEQVGGFNTSFRCCEDYDLWLRVSCRNTFLLVDQPLTIKEGGRPDQVSFQFRIGMDKLRIQAILDLLESGLLNQSQAKLARQEIMKKSTVYGKGCLRHDKLEEGRKYLQLAEKIFEKQNVSKESA